MKPYFTQVYVLKLGGGGAEITFFLKNHEKGYISIKAGQKRKNISKAIGFFPYKVFN